MSFPVWQSPDPQNWFMSFLLKESEESEEDDNTTEEQRKARQYRQVYNVYVHYGFLNNNNFFCELMNGERCIFPSLL